MILFKVSIQLSTNNSYKNVSSSTMSFLINGTNSLQIDPIFIVNVSTNTEILVIRKINKMKLFIISIGSYWINSKFYTHVLDSEWRKGIFRKTFLVQLIQFKLSSSNSINQKFHLVDTFVRGRSHCNVQLDSFRTFAKMNIEIGNVHLKSVGI